MTKLSQKSMGQELDFFSPPEEDRDRRTPPAPAVGEAFFICLPPVPALDEFFDGVFAPVFLRIATV